MGRIYRVVYSGTLTNAGGNSDLLTILPASNKPCRLAGWILGQTSELGDAAEEIVRLSVQRLPATVTNGSGGSSPTPAPQDSVDPAAGFTARVNDTTVATTSGAAIVLEEVAWNVRASPYERYIPEEMRPLVRSGEALVVRLESTVADDVTGALTFLVEEL
jgi:hypothetical protein